MKPFQKFAKIFEFDGQQIVFVATHDNDNEGHFEVVSTVVFDSGKSELTLKNFDVTNPEEALSRISEAEARKCLKEHLAIVGAIHAEEKATGKPDEKGTVH